MSGQLNTLSLGPETAAGLGQNIPLWRGVTLVIVVILAGSAVSLAGPLGFVGLVVPHIVRLAIGIDYRWILPFCAVLGACLVVAGDAVPRAIWAIDMPVGVMMVLLGAPFFIYLARRAAMRSGTGVRR